MGSVANCKRVYCFKEYFANKKIQTQINYWTNIDSSEMKSSLCGGNAD